MVQDVQVTSIRYAHIYKQSKKKNKLYKFIIFGELWRTDSFIFLRNNKIYIF